MNTANLITLVRIGLVPVYAILIYMDRPLCTVLAGVVFVAASITDSLDGYVARKNNQVTDLGKFLDPLADKLLVLTALAILSAERGRIPAWALVIVVARELVVTSLRSMAALQKRVIAADVYGKAKTALQIVAVSIMHFEDYLPEPLTGVASVAADAAFYFSLAMTVLSGLNYLRTNIDVIKE